MAAKKRPHEVRRDRTRVPRSVVIKAARAAGITPLEYMLQVLNRPTPVRGPKERTERFHRRIDDDTSLRLAAARYAAPYVHARIATELKVTSPPPEALKPIDLTELSKSVAFLLTMAEHRKTIDVTPTSH